MSKGNMLLGHARGKVGDLVFSRANGQQIVRSRAAVVKNPQTESQMVQRIILNTVAQAYSRMRAITDHSFEGVQAGQKTMSLFLRKNIDSLRSIIAKEIADGGDFDGVWAFTPIGDNGYAPNAYIISQGSLPAVPVAVDSATKGSIALAENTYQGVLDAFGLLRGDQLTFVATHGSNMGNQTFYFARVILDPVDANGVQLPLSTAFIGAENNIVSPNPRNEGVFSSLTFADSKISFGFSTKSMTGAAVIVSRKNNDGSWLRSNASMTIRWENLAGFLYSMQECLDMFAAGGFDTINDRYLNNAGKGAIAGQGGNTFTTETKSGDTVTLVALRQGTGALANYIVAVDRAGNEYVIYDEDAMSHEYHKYLTSMVGYAQDAWLGVASEATTNANTIDIDNFTSDFAEWLVSAGASYTILIYKVD